MLQEKFILDFTIWLNSDVYLQKFFGHGMYREWLLYTEKTVELNCHPVSNAYIKISKHPGTLIQLKTHPSK